MPGRGQIAFARRHAQTVEQVETCAPEVEGGYLDRALARMRLPISVGALEHPDGVLLVVQGGLSACAVFKPAEATRAYFDLVSTFTNSPPPAHLTPRASSSLSGDTAAGNTPLGPAAFSSPSAANPSADTAQAVAVQPGADSPSAPGASLATVP